MLSKNVISKIVNAIRSRLDRDRTVANVALTSPIAPVTLSAPPVIVEPLAGSLPDLVEASTAPVLGHDDVLGILRERQAVCWFGDRDAPGAKAFRAALPFFATDMRAAWREASRLHDGEPGYEIEFAVEAHRHLPDIVDLVPGTWLHEALNRLNMAGGRVMLDRHVGGVEDVQTFLIRYAIVLPTTRSEDWATWETLWNGPHLLDMLDALRRMVEWEIGTGVRGEGGRVVLEEIDGMAAALTSLDAQRFGLAVYMRLRWDEIVVRYRKADAFLDHAVNHVGATSDLCEHGVLMEVMKAQARAFGLIDDADDGGYGLTALGYRYVFERVLRLPSVLLPAMTACEVDDGMGSRLVFETPGSLPFGDRHSLAVALEDGGETVRRRLTEAFRFADPADAERFADLVGEGVR